MDKNVITRIKTNKRYVTDVELKALTEIFNISYEYLHRKKRRKVIVFRIGKSMTFRFQLFLKLLSNRKFQ